MRIAAELSYRYADAVLQHEAFRQERDEVFEVLKNALVPLLDPKPKAGGTKRRSRPPRRGDSGPRYFFLPVNQIQLNADLDAAFKDRGWDFHPLVVSKDKAEAPETGLRADFKKSRIQVEVQFGNMARWYSDVFKFQLSYAQGEIDVAMLIVPTQRFANLIDENVAYFERVSRELPWAKMSLTLPILVLGVEPEDFEPVRARYEEAAEAFKTQEKANLNPFQPPPCLATNARVNVTLLRGLRYVCKSWCISFSRCGYLSMSRESTSKKALIPVAFKSEYLFVLSHGSFLGSGLLVLTCTAAKYR